MTATLQCLHEQFSGQYLTAVRTSCNAIFEHNPYVSSHTDGDVIKMEYPSIHQSNQRPIHFLQAFSDYLGGRLGIDLKMTYNRPFIYLSDSEKGWINQVEEQTKEKTKFIVVNAGYKDCFPTKWWGRDNYQAVVDALRDRILFVQIGERGHHHPELNGVMNLLGKTDTRQLIRLCYWAACGLGPSTFIQHIFAAHQRPYVCVHSGMEPLNWMQYSTQVTLTSLNRLPCCIGAGCWKGKLEDCAYPITKEGYRLPKCLDMIKPAQVIEAIEQMMENGVV